jgi:hypothetical protein
MPDGFENAFVGKYDACRVDAAVFALFCDEMLFCDLDLFTLGVTRQAEYL